LANASAELNLNGGVVSTRNIVRRSSQGYGKIRFNGGTLRPRTAGQTLQNMSAVTISTNSAVIDTSRASYTIAQNLLSDPDVDGAIDGGLIKIGANTLALTGTDNTFRGTVDVQEGLLQARLAATNDIHVASQATLDALGTSLTAGDLGGEGALTNGAVKVLGTLNAGVGDTPAGAAMSVENLTLAAGSIYACASVGSGPGIEANDYVTVTDALTVEGAGVVDLERTQDDPITIPYDIEIMSYGSFSGSFAGWQTVNTGLPDGTAYATVVRAEDGVVTLSIRYSGLIMILR
jgi:autotransporter-associated beta strand protein